MAHRFLLYNQRRRSFPVCLLAPAQLTRFRRQPRFSPISHASFLVPALTTLTSLLHCSIPHSRAHVLSRGGSRSRSRCAPTPEAIDSNSGLAEWLVSIVTRGRLTSFQRAARQPRVGALPGLGPGYAWLLAPPGELSERETARAEIPHHAPL